MQKDILKKKRFFVPEDMQIDSWEVIAPLFQSLLNESLNSEQEIKAWQEKVRELKAVLHQEKTVRYIEMTCHVDDPGRLGRYQDFISKMEPRYKTGFQQLNMKLQASCGEARFHQQVQRSKATQQKMLALKSEENELKSAYQQIVGSLNLQYKGQNFTLQQASRFSGGGDRETRKTIWELQSQQWLGVADKIEDIFTRLIQVRTQLAVQAGFSNYMEYVFHAYKRVDYRPEDCVSFHRLSAGHVVPLLKKMQAENRKKLDLKVLRPFDLGCDEDGSALRPFADTDELLKKMQQLFEMLGSRFGLWFQQIVQNDLLDLENRKGKAPGSYCVHLEESRLPFIFMNATGTHQDVITLLHESGHAFHYLAMVEANEQKVPPREMSELAAIGMEVMGTNFLNIFYSSAEDVRRARKKYFQQQLLYLTGIATIDAFTHWVYTHKDHSVRERRDCWIKLSNIYQGDVDYFEYQNILETGYHQVSLFFEDPFYFIEYAFARIGSLQLLCNFQKDKGSCINDYLYSLSLGGRISLPELYQAAGVKFGFEEGNFFTSLANLEQEFQKINYN